MFDKNLIKAAIADRKFNTLIPADIKKLLGGCTCNDQGKRDIELGYQRIAKEMATELGEFKQKLKKYNKKGKRS